MTPILPDPTRRRLLAGLVFAAAALPALPALADSLDDFRRQGVIGERYDGAAVLRQPNPAAEALVVQVNARRTRIYAERAKQQNVPAGQVGRVYARQIFERAPSGTWFLDESGRWVRK